MADSEHPGGSLQALEFDFECGDSRRGQHSHMHGLGPLQDVQLVHVQLVHYSCTGGSACATCCCACLCTP